MIRHGGNSRTECRRTVHPVIKTYLQFSSSPDTSILYIILRLILNLSIAICYESLPKVRRRRSSRWGFPDVVRDTSSPRITSGIPQRWLRPRRVACPPPSAARGSSSFTAARDSGSAPRAPGGRSAPKHRAASNPTDGRDELRVRGFPPFWSRVGRRSNYVVRSPAHEQRTTTRDKKPPPAPHWSSFRRPMTIPQRG